MAITEIGEDLVREHLREEHGNETDDDDPDGRGKLCLRDWGEVPKLAADDFLAWTWGLRFQSFPPSTACHQHSIINTAFRHWVG